MCSVFLQACVAVFMDINYLPPELLTKIFSYLSQEDLLTTISTVCHYWNEVAFSSSLWKRMCLIVMTDEELDIYLQNIARYKDFVQSLVIKSEHLIKFFVIRKNRNLSNLRNLKIWNGLPDEDVNFCKNIVDLYPGIVAIEFEIFKAADVFGYLSVLSNLMLRDLDIVIRTRADTIALNKIICEFISKQCSLQSLGIHCPVLQSETNIKLLRNLKDLTYLDLSNSAGVDDCMFTALPELSKLTELDLSFTSVNDEGLKNIATMASHLKILTLRQCKKLSDIGIGYIADGCHCLERLTITNDNDVGGVVLFPSTLKTLGEGCQKLKYLRVINCIGLDNSGVNYLVQNCHDLEYLFLRSKNISSPSLHAISHFCSNLFHLLIHGYNINTVSVESILTNNRFIKDLDISGCSNINGIDLCKSTATKSVIFETHSHVTSLRIKGKTDIGFSAIEQIVTFCPDLCYLSLSPINAAIRDDASEIAFQKCSMLGMLGMVISAPEKMTDLSQVLE